jgi:NAD(P)-dependent dehydrogenase (short-subunit alcohol dehydrogenase family)
VTRLAGKIALITGGGTGMGRACALRFAKEGARVALAGRRLEPLESTAAEICAAGGEALAIACDVTRGADAGRAVRETAARFGGLHVLVNSAGVLHVSSVESISEGDWDRVLDVNLKGPFLMSRAALPEFRKAGGGAIVNIGSILGLVAMKELFTRASDPEAARRARLASIPLGRMGQPEDAAHLAVYLASEESAWVTGAAIPLDGGLTAY